ncbi:hypothetical protein DVS28_a1437 [Euzebya pacifica]|uniref:HNH nuclease domain-containing protein n=1 Tax=Euzebya pacifica TaxID=1608957 RepID=A0A346XV89_9ACTN|nr:hypothetical protein DVS28_a1437 [Euzebya pacifica]
MMGQAAVVAEPAREGIARVSEEVAAHEARVERLVDELTGLFSTLSAGEARFVALVGEFDELGGWADGQTRTCAHWLNWKLGIAMPAARERVRVARALRELPRLAGAFGEGRLSYSKVRAVTRVATQATEETLLGFALYATAAQLERICRTWRQVRAASEPDAELRQRATQRFDVVLTDDGMMDVAASLPTDVGVVVAQALTKASTQLFADRGPEGEGEDRRIEALRVICESFLAGGSSGTSSADIWQVVVSTSADALARAAEQDGRCEGGGPTDVDGSDDGDRTTDDEALHVADHGLGQVEDGPVLARSVLSRLACDAVLVGMVTARDSGDGTGQPIGIGRRRRTIPGWLRKLVHQRDPGCRFPGCPNTRWTDAHHIIHWAAGGRTDLDNLVRLCRFHHTSVHQLGIGIGRSVADRSWAFTTADGHPIEPPRLRAADGALEPGRGLGSWEGDPARMGPIVDALVLASAAHDRSGAVPDVSAETSEPLGRQVRDPAACVA